MNAITNLLSNNAKKIFQFASLAFIGLYFFYTLFFCIDGFAFTMLLTFLVYAAILGAVAFGVMKSNDKMFEVGAFTFAVYYGLQTAVSAIGAISNVSFDDAISGLYVLFLAFAGLGYAALMTAFFCNKFGKTLPEILVPLGTIVALAFMFLSMVFFLIFMIKSNNQSDLFTPYSVVYILSMIFVKLADFVGITILATLSVPAKD